MSIMDLLNLTTTLDSFNLTTAMDPLNLTTMDSFNMTTTAEPISSATTLDPLNLTNVIIEAVIAVAAIIGNSIVLLALYRNKHLHTVTNCLIASLAIADLLVGVSIPFYILPLFGLPHEFYSCLFVNCLIVILTGTSVLNLLAVTVERFIAIQFPFWYHAHFNIREAVLAGLCSWVLGILLGLVPMMGWNNGWNDDDICVFVLIISLEQHVYFTFFGTIALPLFLMLLIYISIFAAVRKSSRQIAAFTVKDGEGGDEDGHGKGGGRNTTTKAEIKAAKRFALIIGIFTVCWLPLEVMNCVTVWYQTTCIPCVVVAVWFTQLNSAINPLLYAYGNSSLRHAMKNTLLCRESSASGNGDDSTISERT